MVDTTTIILILWFAAILLGYIARAPNLFKTKKH